MTRRSCLPIFALAAAILSCTGADAPPAPLDTKNEACRSCRMPVSDARLAAQLAAPGEEPKFFDDLGCMRAYLDLSTSLPEGSIVFVADHRTRRWVRASQAVFTKTPGIETPMGSHWIAHADAASLAADVEAMGGSPLSRLDVFGPKDPPDGDRRD